MLDQLHRIGDWLNGVPGGQWAPAVVAALVVLALVALIIRSWRGKDLNAKKVLGFGVVQSGVTFIIVTGVYGFFRGVLSMPLVEASILAVFIEAATWGAVGYIYAHGKKPDSTGFGEAGPFFWFSVTGGGLLAVLGSSTTPVAIGRIIIVCFGAYMWYLQLLQVTRRSGRRSRLRWTPKRLLLAMGAIEPADEDVENEAREWQIRRLAKAIRWSNSRWPWSFFGGRALVKRAETTTEDVLAEARRRWAAAHVLRAHTRPGSAVMASVIKAVEESQIGSAARTADAPLQITGGEPRETDPTLDIDEVAAAVLRRLEARRAPAALPAPTANGNGHNGAAVTGSVVRSQLTLPATRVGGTATTAKAVTAETASFKVPSDPTQQAVWLAVWAEIQANPGVDAEVASRPTVNDLRPGGVSRQVVNRIRRAGELGLLDQPAAEAAAEAGSDTTPGDDGSTAQPPRRLEIVS